MLHQGHRSQRLRGLGLFLMGLLASRAFFGSALAQEAPQPTEPRALELRCKLFPNKLDRDVLLETSDQTGEVGQWIGSQLEEGWLLHGVDFEVAQKPTGFAQGWYQVCVSRAS